MAANNKAPFSASFWFQSVRFWSAIVINGLWKSGDLMLWNQPFA
jgi:hypothetical protein